MSPWNGQSINCMSVLEASQQLLTNDVTTTAYKSGTAWIQTIVTNVLFQDGSIPGPIMEISPWVDMHLSYLNLFWQRPPRKLIADFPKPTWRSMDIRIKRMCLISMSDVTFAMYLCRCRTPGPAKPPLIGRVTVTRTGRPATTRRPVGTTKNYPIFNSSTTPIY
jgi:hypothetical protein